MRLQDAQERLGALAATRRRNELQRLGRLVLEFTDEDVTTRTIDIVDTFRATLTTRSCRAG